MSFTNKRKVNHASELRTIVAHLTRLICRLHLLVILVLRTILHLLRTSTTSALTFGLSLIKLVVVADMKMCIMTVKIFL